MKNTENKAPLGIIGAMEIEICGLREKMTEKAELTCAGVRFVRGKLCGQTVVTAVCGMGKVSAAVCAQALIDHFDPYAVINVGVAGTLTKKLDVGDIAVATRTVCHDMDTTALGDPPCFISGINLIYISTDEQLTRSLENCCKKEGLNVLAGTIASGDRFITDPEEKANLNAAHDAVACEMEGQSISQVCYMNGVSCAILRSISDSINGGAMDYERFKPLAADHSCRVILRYLESL